MERFWWLFKTNTTCNEYFPTFANRGDCAILGLITDSFQLIGKQNPQGP